MRTGLRILVFTLLTFSSAFASVTGQSMRTTGPKIGTWNVKATPVAHTNAPNSIGEFLRISALSVNSAATLDEDNLPPPLPYLTPAGALGSYPTKQTRSTGEKYDAQSKVTATATAVTRTEVEWNSLAANYGIEVLAPTGDTGETAEAAWTVFDPMMFTDLDLLPWDIDLLFQPEQGWGFEFPDFAPDETGTATATGAASTDYNNLGTLLSWVISFHGPMPSPEVVFTSNPILGLDDAAIRAAILNRYSYNPATRTWNFDSTGFSLGASFRVTGVEQVSITTSMGSSLALASGVPEPTSVALIATGLVGIAILRRRR